MQRQHLFGVARWPCWLVIAVLLTVCCSRTALSTPDTDVMGAGQADEPNSVSDDDIYSDDDEVTTMTLVGNQMVSPKPTIMPYFERKTKTTYARPGTRVVLDCPVKNYNATSHQILWYKDDRPITNGLQALTPMDSTVDSKFNLIIEHFSNATTGNYYCIVLPQKVRSTTLLKLGEQPVKADLASTNLPPKTDGNNGGGTPGFWIADGTAHTLTALVLAFMFIAA